MSSKSHDLAVVNGRVIDPKANFDRRANLVVDAGRIVDCTDSPVTATEVIDATDKIVCPGLVDMHVHLREPGGEAKETIQTGTRAAVAGGFTTVACMPNTSPPIDRVDRAKDLMRRISTTAHCNVIPIACLTLERAGRELVDFDALAAAGLTAFSDDGDGVPNSNLMAEAFSKVSSIQGMVIQHCEDSSFERGVMHLGDVSAELGLPGMCPLSEEVMIARDLLLCEAIGARYHVAHVSTARAVQLIRRARAANVQVTTEVCPHHILLTDEACRDQNSNFKMHPPLRPASDVQACIEGVLDGTIEVLATDHAPHTSAEKSTGFRSAPAGVVGLETALSLNVEALLHPGALAWPDIIRLMSTNPAALLGIDAGTLRIGSRADITVIDPDHHWTVAAGAFFSKSANSPFVGRSLVGRPSTTIVAGQIKYRDFDVLPSFE
jgi:dihydroorotase